MKWVLQKERLPIEERAYYVRYEVFNSYQDIEVWGGWIDFTKGCFPGFEESETLEWLDETPVLIDDRDVYVECSPFDKPKDIGDYTCIMKADESEYAETHFFADDGNFYAFESEGICYSDPTDLRLMKSYLKKVKISSLLK